MRSCIILYMSTLWRDRYAPETRRQGKPPRAVVSNEKRGPQECTGKEIKASDEDFAMMLYPMYRRGELTKQEFNDFFNLVPITSGKEIPPPLSRATL